MIFICTMKDLGDWLTGWCNMHGWNKLQLINTTAMQINLPKQVPLLPGYIYTDPYKENHHKTQQLNLVNGVSQFKNTAIQEDYDQYLIDSMTKGKFDISLIYGERKAPDNDYIPRIQAPWIKYDRQVIRFYAFFQEHVVESPLENYRLRKVVIYYYLSDETILVIEPRIENSGIPQGVFIKRQKIPKRIGFLDDHFQWKDFQIGMNINFFERIFHIYDCDKFTKEFYDYMNVKLNDPEEEPNDAFQQYKEKKDLKINPPDTKEYKEYIEVKLGGGHPNGGLAKYLNNDRKVLSFSALWEDSTLEGGTNLFVVNYFLADDTVEVKEVRKQNSGRDPFPLLLRRQKLPKIPINTHYPGMSLKKEEFYNPQDFVIGSTVIIFGRECMVYDCDQFTKEFFKDVYGVTQTPIQVDSYLNRRVVHQIPPYNGYGTLEDSLGSVYALQPKPPKKDVIKMFTEDQNVLRFEARLISKTKDYNNRKFIVNFFCGDDTIQVYQQTDKNSGVVGGKFLERKKHRSDKENRYLVETDFQLGGIVDLDVYSFQLLRVDQFTAKYMAERTEKFPQASIQQITDKLKKIVFRHKSYDEFLIWFIKTVDPTKKGTLTYDELYKGLTSIIPLAHQEVYAIFRHCRADKDSNVLSMKSLWKVMGGS